MSHEHSAHTTVIREVVGVFADRQSLDAAVADLKEAGIAPGDLSVLSSHDSLEAVERPANSWRDAAIALAGEYKVMGPLAASGGIFLAGGPVAGTIAAVIGAAVSSLAAKEVLEEVASAPHVEDFQRALDAGSVILWVWVGDSATEQLATKVLTKRGADNVHVNERRTSGA